MIPKTIHYVWLGTSPLSPLIVKCIESWKKNLPEYEIICWNENNLDISDPVYLKTLKEKKWAFASDIARLHVLYKYGGVYLDTDMEIVKSLDPLLKTELFIGLEDDCRIAAGIIGCMPKNKFIEDSLNAVTLSLSSGLVPIPQVISEVYKSQSPTYKFDHKIYEKHFFYPYNPFTSDIKILFYSDINQDTYAIHHWGHSWKMTFSEKIYQKAKLFMNKNIFNHKKGH